MPWDARVCAKPSRWRQPSSWRSAFPGSGPGRCRTKGEGGGPRRPHGPNPPSPPTVNNEEPTWGPAAPGKYFGLSGPGPKILPPLPPIVPHTAICGEWQKGNVSPVLCGFKILRMQRGIQKCPPNPKKKTHLSDPPCPCHGGWGPELNCPPVLPALHSPQGTLVSETRRRGCHPPHTQRPPCPCLPSGCTAPESEATKMGLRNGCLSFFAPRVVANTPSAPECWGGATDMPPGIQVAHD